MGVITLLRGFKLDGAKLDAFLQANGLSGIDRFEPFPHEAAEIVRLFTFKGVECEVRVFLPYVAGFNRSRSVFVCCDWVHVLVAREIDDVLQKPVPPSFEAMRKSLGAESEVARYIVYSDEDKEGWTPQELVDRHTPPIHCGVCDAVFEFWQDRMTHRHAEHGISEDREPLPDC